MKARKFRLFFVIYLLNLMLSNKLQASGQTLTVGTAIIPYFFDPAYSKGASTLAILSAIHRTLVKTNSDGRIVGDLAYKWVARPDQRNFSFCIKEARFHNGKPVGFEDVKYSIERFSETEGLGFAGITLKELKPKVTESRSFLASDKTHPHSFCVDINISKPFKNFIYLFAMPSFPIVPKGGKKYDIVGAGAYKVDLYDEVDRRVVLKKKDSYCNGVCKIVILEIGQNEDFKEMIETGKIDLYLGLVDIERIPRESTHIKVSYFQNLNTYDLIFNVRRQVFQDKNFREHFSRFIQYLIFNSNKKSEAIEFNPFFMPRSTMPQQYFQRPVNLINPERFLARCKYKSPVRRRIKWVGAMNELSRESVGILRDVLKECGYDLVYIKDYYEAAARASLKEEDYDVAIGGWVSFFDRPEAFSSMISTMILETSNAERILNPYIRKLDEIRNISDPVVKTQNLSRTLIDLENEYVYAPLYSFRTPVIHSRKLDFSYTIFRHYIRLDEIKFMQN